MPKLNKKLQITFQNLNSNREDDATRTGSANNELAQLAKFVDEKWQKYLGTSQKISNNNTNASYNIPKQGTGLIGIQNLYFGNWENSPAYHRLAYESGSRLLDEKWNQYLGGSPSIGVGGTADLLASKSILNKQMNRKTADFSSSTSSLFVPPSISGSQHRSTNLIRTDLNLTQLLNLNNNSSKLTDGTLDRLNQHRNWLRKFKENSDFSRFNSNNTINY